MTDRDDLRGQLTSEILSFAEGFENDGGRPLVHLNTFRGAARFVDDAFLIRNQMPPGASVADIGCGIGQMTYLLHRLGFDVVAADIGDMIPPLVQHIPGNGDGRLVRYVTIESPDFTNDLAGGFDGICLSGVLEHVPDFSGFLRQVRSLMRPNGLLFIFRFPNRFSWIEWCNDRIVGAETTPHPLRFTSAELSLFMRWHGFRVRHMAYEEILPVNLSHVPARLRQPYKRCAPLLTQLSRGLRMAPAIRALSTSFRIVVVNAVNWPDDLDD